MWVARFSEDVIGPNGVITTIRRSEVFDTVAEIGTQRRAEQILADDSDRSIAVSIGRPCERFTISRGGSVP